MNTVPEGSGCAIPAEDLWSQEFDQRVLSGEIGTEADRI